MEVMQGTLVFDYKSFRVFDGVDAWKVACPQLLFRLLYKKRKRDRVCGKWWIICGWIVWFVKKKYYEETKITKEKLYYKREDIKC